MPENSPEIKKKLVQINGGNLVQCGPLIKDREKALQEVHQVKNAEIVHPYNDFAVIQGQGTISLEIFEQICSENFIDFIIVPVGGGGLLSGTCIATKGISPKTKVVAAEPFLARDAYISLQTGNIHPQLPPVTICDGIRTSLGDKTFKIIKKYCDGIFLVDEQEVVLATNLLWERLKIIVEPSSATVLAAILKYKNVFEGKNVVAVISGGNVDIQYKPPGL
ncbi:serine racemase, putative [Ichthyophthirius multifiliis]|uniref:Serine racemase, putative n=1 Tax=Ichthyophthirius multifiliis TaxID=5932 RepID=G0QLH3_ICHMU|nr:serine racemase, putative [Ichthyophthirius multifiliis]EGR33933.1 serine racemase, putative [Ichthyophthirius multifiliis]|eukprot:XP_004039237.1 serine racemase, putative [Ichthyophthirius multifiliis]